MYDRLAEAMIVSNIMDAMVFVVGALIMFAIVMKMISNRKSYDYRKYLADLYVAAMIRSQASKNDLDLDKEEKSFLATYKVHRKLAMKDIDDRIEASLNDDVNKTIESKTDKK